MIRSPLHRIKHETLKYIQTKSNAIVIFKWKNFDKQFVHGCRTATYEEKHLLRQTLVNFARSKMRLIGLHCTLASGQHLLTGSDN